MNLLRIQYFVEAAKTENFTRAAKNLYTSQPNLSKQITLMEQELGTLLFHRSNRSVYLTQAGRYLYDELKDIPSHTAMAFRHAQALGRGDSGSLSIGILEGQQVNSELLLRFSNFRDKYPALELTLERNDFSALRWGLENYHFDLIITLSFEVENLSGVCYKIIIEQLGAIAINRKNPLSQQESLSLANLRNEDFVVISPKKSETGYSCFLRQCASYGFTPNIVHMSNSLESLLLCVEMGIGIALLDRNTRLEKNDNIRIIQIPNSTKVNVNVAWLENNKNPMVQRLVNIL